MLSRRAFGTQFLALLGCARLVLPSIEQNPMADHLLRTPVGVKPFVTPQDIVSNSDDAIDKFCVGHGCDACVLDALDSSQKRILALRLLQPEMTTSGIADALGMNIRKVQRTMLTVFDLWRTHDSV